MWAWLSQRLKGESNSERDEIPRRHNVPILFGKNMFIESVKRKIKLYLPIFVLSNIRAELNIMNKRLSSETKFQDGIAALLSGLFKLLVSIIYKILFFVPIIALAVKKFSASLVYYRVYSNYLWVLFTKSYFLYLFLLLPLKSFRHHRLIIGEYR